MSSWLISFLTAFILMEAAAWSLHKYVMHGFLWNLHEDHHVPPKNRKWQKNDFFALFFAVPSFLSILFGTLYNWPILEGIGFGVMAYGAVYFTVHEVVIHRRLNIFDFGGPYFEALKLAHRHHHQVRTKEGASNFGMLVVPLRYFSRQTLTKRAKL